jgi:HK97 family phage portal protein
MFFADYQQDGIAPRVTHEAAMSFSAVFSCVSLISETIAALPVGVYVHYGDRRYTRPKPPWMEKPNVETNWFTFMQQSLSSLLLGGDSFSYKVRDSAGLVAELWPVDSRRVVVKRVPGGEREYEIDGRPVPAGDLMHIPGLMLPGYLRGLSPVECARQTIDLGLNAETVAPLR